MDYLPFEKWLVKEGIKGSTFPKLEDKPVIMGLKRAPFPYFF